MKFGDMQPTAPVFATGGTRLLPQTATGFDLTSSEIAGLDLEAGHFTSTNSGMTSNHDHDIYATYANIAANSASFVGGKYTFTPSLSATVYAGELEDIWRQYYTNQTIQAARQHVRRDAQAARELIETAQAVQRVAHDQSRVNG